MAKWEYSKPDPRADLAWRREGGWVGQAVGDPTWFAIAHEDYETLAHGHFATAQEGMDYIDNILDGDKTMAEEHEQLPAGWNATERPGQYRRAGVGEVLAVGSGDEWVGTKYAGCVTLRMSGTLEDAIAWVEGKHKPVETPNEDNSKDPPGLVLRKSLNAFGNVMAEAMKKDGAMAHEAEKTAPDYEPLLEVLDDAYHQAATGKGVERHGGGKPFMDQPIMTITRARGIGFPLGQADKKIDEAHRMIQNGNVEDAIAELHGAIIYTAAAVLAVQEWHDGGYVDTKIGGTD